MTIDEQVAYESEGTSLDFKATQYLGKQNEALLKDVMAMANADVEGDRRIILGVKAPPDGEKIIRGIERDAFIDAATYQQLIQANIEPDLEITYVPHEYEGKIIGVLTISACDDQPYMMKKQYNSLQAGDSFIRKGTHQLRLMRADLDRMFQRRLGDARFKGNVTVTFTAGGDERLDIAPGDPAPMPSEIAAARIRDILDERSKIARSGSPYGPRVLGSINFPNPFGPTPYEDWPTEKLQRALADVAEDYRDRDEYAEYELNGHKINLDILNMSDQYLEDVTVVLEAPRLDGLKIADRVRDDPSADVALHLRMPGDLHYPVVSVEGDRYIVSDELGDVRHQQPTRMFGEDLRIVLSGALAGTSIQLRCRIFARNLAKPIVKHLEIVVRPSASAPQAHAVGDESSQ